MDQAPRITDHHDASLVTASLLGAAGLLGPAVLLAAASGFEPAVAIFVLVVGLVHAAPHWAAAKAARSRRSSRLGVVGAAGAFAAQATLLAWAWSVLDDDAQAGLVFVFVTPPLTAAIAGGAFLCVVLGSRRR